MAVCRSENAASGEHVHNRWYEDPPQALLVVVVEQAILDPCIAVVVEPGSIAIGSLVSLSSLPDLESEEPEDSGEDGKSCAGEYLCTPRIPVRKLVETKEHPHAV